MEYVVSVSLNGIAAAGFLYWSASPSSPESRRLFELECTHTHIQHPRTAYRDGNLKAINKNWLCRCTPLIDIDPSSRCSILMDESYYQYWVGGSVRAAVPWCARVTATFYIAGQLDWRSRWRLVYFFNLFGMYSMSASWLEKWSVNSVCISYFQSTEW